MEKGPSNHIDYTNLKYVVVKTIVAGKPQYRVYTFEPVLGHGMAQVQPIIVGDMHTPNGAFDTSLMTGSGIGLIENGNPLPMEGNDYHRIDIPTNSEEYSRLIRFPKEVQDRNLRGQLAMLRAGVSDQKMLGLVGVPGAMSLPEPIFSSVETRGQSFQFRDFAPNLEWLAPEMKKKYWSTTLGFKCSGHGMARVQPTIVGDKRTPNGGAFASEGDASLITGSVIGLMENENPLLREWTDYLSIDIPANAEEYSPWSRFLKEVRDQNPRGQVAMFCAAVSAQTILGLVGGPGAMNLPKPVFYSAAAANAIAFVGSSLALLLLKKKPSAARILETTGFASAIATFLLMMGAFMPWK